MHEVFLPLMVMLFTVLVMLGMVIVFRGWMVERDRLVAKMVPDASRRAPAE